MSSLLWDMSSWQENQDTIAFSVANTVSGEWGMIFLYLSLVITVVVDTIPLITISQNQLLAICVFYSTIHLYAYLRYTLRRVGYTIPAFLKQINGKRYIGWGVLGFIGVLVSWQMSGRWMKIPLYIGMGFAAYHVMVRGAVRKRRVRLAASAPYISTALVLYNILRDKEMFIPSAYAQEM